MARRTTKTMTAGKPWARYLRLSKAEAAEIRGLSKEQRLELTDRKLDAQLRRITRWMDAQGLPYDDGLVFRDPGLSAYKEEVTRPQWDAVMGHARSGELSGIAVVAVDRLTRIVRVGEDVIDLAKKVDVKIGGPDVGLINLTTYDDITKFRGLVHAAEAYSLSNSFKIKEALEERMEAGKPMGGGRSYGFEVVGDKYTMEVPQRPSEVGVVREVAADFLAGKPLAVLAGELNDAGLTTSRGGKWTGANLGRMLGLARYGGEVERQVLNEDTGQWETKVVGHMPGEPILDRDTYDAIRTKLASRKRGRRPTPDFLLTGVLACSNPDCGGLTMNGGRTFPRPDGTRPRVYKCPPLNGGCSRAIMADTAEQAVADHIVKQMADPRNAQRIAKQSKHLDEARTRLRAEQRDLEEQQESLTDKWTAGDLRDAAYERGLANINKRLAKVDAALKASPVGEEASGGTSQAPAKVAAARLREATQDWEGMTPDEKRELLQQYRVRPVVNARRPGARRIDPDRVAFL